MEQMRRRLTIAKISEIIGIGFYDYYRAKSCILKGARKNINFSAELPKESESMQTLVGLFYHDATALIGQVDTIEELRDKVESLILQYQSKVRVNVALKKLGSFGSWREVNFAARRVFEVFRNRNNSHEGLYKSEELLKSKCGTFVGRPDGFYISDSFGKLVELKSNDLRDSSGQLKDEYREQVLFYSFLLYQNERINSLSVRLESMLGDKVEMSISQMESQKFYEECVLQVNAMNESIKKIIDINDLNFITTPTSANCQFCEKRIICGSFKEIQKSLELQGDSYVLQGQVKLKDTRALNADIIDILDANLNEIVRLKCDKVKSTRMTIGATYSILNVRMVANIFECGSRTQVLDD